MVYSKPDNARFQVEKTRNSFAINQQPFPYLIARVALVTEKLTIDLSVEKEFIKTDRN